MAAVDAQRKSWTDRDYILAGLGGCLAATAIVIIVSIVLRPGRIIFFVTQASHKVIPGGGMNLNITISANNTSHRAKVKFLSFFVVLTNSTTSPAKYDCHVEPTFPFPTAGYLSEPRSLNINASVHLLGRDIVSSFTVERLESVSGGLTVVLTSEVRFLIGAARTKIFDIRVSCPGVTFVQERPNSRAQKAFSCDG